MGRRLAGGPLGLVTNLRRSPQSLACAQWLQTLVSGGARVILPEISDYEVRRELLRANRMQGLERLDALAALVEYVPLTPLCLSMSEICVAAFFRVSKSFACGAGRSGM